MSDTKFCKDCKHYDAKSERCLHPEAFAVNYVTGETLQYYAATMRGPGGECGTIGNFWEPK